MAASSPPLLLLAISLSIFLISPAQSQTCKSQKFTANKVFLNCSDLPVLTSYLHWTYNASNSSLSVAFTAPPAKSDGWVAWAINPTGTGMVGAQALIAVRNSNGSISLTTYNISSYTSIIPSKLSFEVWDESTEFANGTITIFASVKVKENAKSLNHVWQVGPGINQTTGFLIKHEFNPENLAAKETLSLVSNSSATAPSASPTGSPSSSPPASPAPGSGNGGAASPPHAGKSGGVSLFGSRNSIVWSIASTFLLVFVNLLVAF